MLIERGFTIIELLVTIAIIGILATVILGSLSDAREEGLGAKVKSELSMLTKRAKIEESQSLTYDVVCGSNGYAMSPEIARIITSIERFSPEAVVCNSTTGQYAASAALGDGGYWCVDSVGYADVAPAQLAVADYACP